MGWVVTKGIKNLQNQFNAAFPNRSKESDGTVGDLAHQDGTSGHNPDLTGNAEYKDGDSLDEVRACDVTADLRTTGVTMQKVVDHIRALPNVSSVLRYIIFNRKIYKASNGWKAETYTGPSPHDHHAHFSGARTQAADNDTTFNYRLTELLPKGWDDMATQDQVKAAAKEALLEVLTETAVPYAIKRIEDNGWRPTTILTRLDYMLEALVAGGVQDVDGDGQKDDSTTLQSRLNRVEAALGGLTARPVDPFDAEDRTNVITGVLAGLSPLSIATLVVNALPPALAKDVADHVLAGLHEQHETGQTPPAVVAPAETPAPSGPVVKGAPPRSDK